MNLLALTDTKLATLHRKVNNEIERRARVAANAHDPAAIIFGNEIAKRALVVAAAGDHSILFIGPPNCGKTMLRAVALELGLGKTFEAWPCPCGERSSRNVTCHCTARQIDRHLRKLPVAEITVEACHPIAQDFLRPGTTLDDMQMQIAGKGDYSSLVLDEVGGNLMKASVRELGLDADTQLRIIFVARTIASLDQSEKIEASHLCEAINYRMLGR